MFLASIGVAGGILSCWDKNVFTITDYVVEQRFVDIKGQWVGLVEPDGVICVYALTDQGERVIIVETLAKFIGQRDCHNFVLFEDFNVVLTSTERCGVHGFGSASNEIVFWLIHLDFKIFHLLGQILPL